MAIPNIRMARAAAWLALPLAIGAAYAQTDKHPVTEPEIRYQAGSSPLGAEDMHQDVNPKAPPMSKADLSITCPTCATLMQPEHAHYKCPRCGYRDSCCF